MQWEVNWSLLKKNNSNIYFVGLIKDKTRYGTLKDNTSERLFCTLTKDEKKASYLSWTNMQNKVSKMGKGYEN